MTPSAPRPLSREVFGMTAIELLDGLRTAGCEPTAAGPRLALRERAPDHLYSRLAVLHTGVRAAIAGRCWYGHADDAAGTRVMLNPANLVPVWVLSLSVEGDMGARDRIPAAAKVELPELFAVSGRLSRRRDNPNPQPHLTGMGPGVSIEDSRRVKPWR